MESYNHSHYRIILSYNHRITEPQPLQNHRIIESQPVQNHGIIESQASITIGPPQDHWPIARPLGRFRHKLSQQQVASATELRVRLKARTRKWQPLRGNEISLQQHFMYNSFVHKKHSQQLEQEQRSAKKSRHWLSNYRNSIRPALVERYSRRINNFIIRLEQDKKELYEYRQETEAKAKELLKEIYRKERFLGDPNFKIRDTSDWNSILSTTQRMEKGRIEKIYQTKYGDANLAFRSIASQSAYNPAAANHFRTRDKQQELHAHNMRFTCKSQSFSENKKSTGAALSRTSNYHLKSQPSNDHELRRMSSNHSHIDEEVRSHAFSLFSVGQQHRLTGDEGESTVSNQKQQQPQQPKDKNSKKVYFKQVVDLEQNSREPQIKKSLHQILVRFGISRIKDLKKQAMLETDNLQSEDF